jgi:hypothetical protein
MREGARRQGTGPTPPLFREGEWIDDKDRVHFRDRRGNDVIRRPVGGGPR